MTLNCDHRAVSQSHAPASRNAVVEYSRHKIDDVSMCYYFTETLKHFLLGGSV